MNPAHRQHGHRVRLEWGVHGAEALLPVDIAVVVDVLSFTTTVSVAVERGTTVIPLRWRDERAAEVAAARDAVLAVRRSVAQPGQPSLSPAGMRTVEAARVVLPSPNGATIATVLADSGAQVVAGSLRNRAAVARWLAPRLADGATLAVIPAGERWDDDALRPAAEDLWGAGAILARLDVPMSPEAWVAVAAFTAVEGTIGAALAGCASGRELAGFPDDVAVAAELDASEVVPVLVDGAFREL